MARTTAASGPGYTRASFPGREDGGGGGGGRRGGRRRRGGMSFLDSLIDPGLLRQAMLQGLEQRKLAFGEWQQGKQQDRWMREQEERRSREGAKREEDVFRNKNLPAWRTGGGASVSGGRSSGGSSIF